MPAGSRTSARFPCPDEPGPAAPRAAGFWGTMPGMTANLSWSEFGRQRPDLAEAGRALFHQVGVGLAFLSTVRADGGPRLHPMCPLIVGGALVAHIIPSAKRDDLHRDGRYAMHSFPCDDNEDAFYITGRAALVGDASLARGAAAQFLAERDMPAEPSGFGDGEFFEFRLSRCLLTRTDGHGDWHPRHTTWSAAAGPGNGDGHPG